MNGAVPPVSPAAGTVRILVAPPPAPVREPNGGWLYAALFCLALTGYPLAAAVTTVLEYESSTISYIFRGLVLLLGVLLFAHVLMQKLLRPFPWVLTLFLFLYLVRLLVDHFIRNLFDADYALLIFIAFVLGPTIFLSTTSALFDEKRIAVAMLIVAGVGVISILTLNRLQLAAGVSDFEVSRRLSFNALNAITVGYTALFTIFAGLTLWQRTVKARPILVLFMALGAWTLLQAASRGPIVAGLLCIAAYALARRKWYIFGIFLLAAVYGVGYVASADLEIVERFSDLAGDRSTNDRLMLQAMSIEFALASPIVGHAYAETITYFYPHNLIVESALALGIGGFALMLYLQVRLLLMVLEFLRKGQLLLPFLILSAIVNANLSSAIWSAADLWITASVAMVLRRYSRLRGGAGQARPGFGIASQGHAPLYSR